MEEMFAEYKTIIVFLHVISAVIWVGGMVAMRFAAHQSFLEIQDSEERLRRVAHALKRLFNIVFPFVIILILTAIVMIKGYSLSASEFATFSHIKEGIWTIMFINLVVMIKRRNRAVEFLEAGDLAAAKFSLGMIGKYMVPLNIILGVIAIFLGSTLSSSF